MSIHPDQSSVLYRCDECGYVGAKPGHPNCWAWAQPVGGERDEQFWTDFTEALARFIYGEKRYKKLPLDAARDDARNYVYNARKLVEHEKAAR